MNDLSEGDVIRRKEERAVMHGNECPCCLPYYDALGLGEEERKQRIDQVH